MTGRTAAVTAYTITIPIPQGRRFDFRLPRSKIGTAICRGLVHLANASDRLGRTLRFDPETERVIGDDESDHLLSDADCGYRVPFVIPEDG